MDDPRSSVKRLWQDHPLFFRAMLVVALILFAATAVVAARIPAYRGDAAELDGAMSETERETRDRVLNSQARRSELAIALLQREMRVKALQEEEAHLAISLEDSTLELRHGAATLRTLSVQIGADSTVRAADGREWRLVRALGERHLADKQVSPAYTVPEWVYVSRGETVPPESARQVEGGLGRYVLRLDDGTEIYTRPATGPLAEGVRPAGFVVEDEEGMRAIFDAIRVDTPVYIF